MFYLQTGLGFSPQTNGISKEGIQGCTWVQRSEQGPGMSVPPLDWQLSDATAMSLSLGSLRAGALPLPSDWMCDDAGALPHSPGLSKHWEPKEAPGCCRNQCSLGLAGQDPPLPRLISSPIAGLPHALSYSPEPRRLSGLGFGEPLQIPQPGPGPGPPASSAQAPPCSATPSACLLSSPLPIPRTDWAASHLRAFARAIPWAWSSLPISPLLSFTILPGPGLVPPPSSLP